jgi:hypothetical protein
METLEESLREQIVGNLYSRYIGEFKKRFEDSEYVENLIEVIGSEVFPSDYSDRALLMRHLKKKLDINNLIPQIFNPWDVINLKEPFIYFGDVKDIFPEGISPEDYREINSRLYNLLLEVYGWRDQVVNLLVTKAKSQGLETALTQEEYRNAIRQVIPDYNTFVSLGVKDTDKLKEYFVSLSREFKGAVDDKNLQITNTVLNGIQKFIEQIETDYLMDEADDIYHNK